MTIFNSLCTIIEACLGSISDAEAARVAIIVHDHQLDNPPEWMEEFLNSIATSAHTKSILRIPNDHEGRENALCNVLWDIEEEIAPLGIDDCGESLYWQIPELNVQVFIGRETGPGYYHGAILPMKMKLNEWLGHQYNADRKKHPKK